MSEELKDKKEYEISFVLSGEDGATEIERELSAIGAEVTFKSPAASTRLAYPLKKHETAYFGYTHFMALPAGIKVLKEALAHNPKVLRSLILTPAVKPVAREPRPAHADAAVARDREKKPVSAAEPKPVEKLITNEALEKKLEEILK